MKIATTRAVLGAGALLLALQAAGQAPHRTERDQPLLSGVAFERRELSTTRMPPRQALSPDSVDAINNEQNGKDK